MVSALLNVMLHVFLSVRNSWQYIFSCPHPLFFLNYFQKYVRPAVKRPAGLIYIE